MRMILSRRNSYKYEVTGQPVLEYSRDIPYNVMGIQECIERRSCSGQSAPSFITPTREEFVLWAHLHFSDLICGYTNPEYWLRMFRHITRKERA